MILVIDNYDSFVHNLARYFRQLGGETLVKRNDEISVSQVLQLDPDAIVISPGPCTPDQAGCSLKVVSQLSGRIPILGVCLGHQAIVQAFGGKVITAPAPIHGRSTQIQHGQASIFSDIPSPMAVGRYHSLIADPQTLPEDLVTTASTLDGIIMAVSHREHTTIGVQFHPESILTEHGYRLIRNFAELAGLSVDANVESSRL